MPNSINYDNKDPLTYDEALKRIASLEKIVSIKDQIIEGIEGDYIDSVNDNLRLAREVDEMTDEVFKSPYLKQKEHVV